MEVKKSSKADLESGRSQRFLLGLVVALACLFVAFEYTIDQDDPLDDPGLMEQLSHEEELPPLLRPENELALAPKAEPAPIPNLRINSLRFISCLFLSIKFHFNILPTKIVKIFNN